MEGCSDKDEEVYPPQLPKSGKRRVKRAALEVELPCEEWTTTARDETINNSKESDDFLSEKESAELTNREVVLGCALELDLSCEKWNIEDDDTRNNSDLRKEVDQPSIYKVPEELRTLKESAYKPRIISIGPIHSNDERLNAMEHIKLSYRDSLCSRVDKYMLASMERGLSAMVDLEAKIQNCYAENFKPINEKQNTIGHDHWLAEMMSLDGCFILELLYRSYILKKNKKVKISNDDPIFGSPMRLRAIRHDLLLLENQIPFFVLEKLFNLTVECIPDRLDNIPLTQYVLSFFGNILSFGKDTLRKKANTVDYHILDLLHNCYLPSHDPPKGKEDDTKLKTRFPSASDLNLAGVKFKSSIDEDLFNINFDRGLLWWCLGARFKIPTLSIYDDTEPLLRNLIAFEQCCPAVPRHITSYCFFMDTLINYPEDVQFLEKAEVLHNYLGTSEDASNLFNNICKEAVVGKFYFSETCEAAGNHCRKRWPRFLASFKRDYFANPWSGLAVLAAFILFGLTIVQTVYTILPYYSKK